MTIFVVDAVAVVDDDAGTEGALFRDLEDPALLDSIVLRVPLPNEFTESLLVALQDLRVDSCGEMGTTSMPVLIRME